MIRKLSTLFLILLFLCGCCPLPESGVSLRRYEMQESPYFLVILVCAEHFEYSSTDKFLCSMARNGRNGRFGHAWIYLRGIEEGRPVELEGGHSGEIDVGQPRYFDGIADALESGDPNPVRTLWKPRHDGFFQEGAGGHCPTYAAKVDLTPEQYRKIVAYLKAYAFGDYALTGPQCTTFAVEIAALADWKLEGEVTLPIKKRIFFDGAWMHLWQDGRYASITFATPDRLERSLIDSVRSGRAEYALDWYLSPRLCTNIEVKCSKALHIASGRGCPWPSPWR